MSKEIISFATDALESIQKENKEYKTPGNFRREVAYHLPTWKMEALEPELIRVIGESRARNGLLSISANELKKFILEVQKETFCTTPEIFNMGNIARVKA